MRAEKIGPVNTLCPRFSFIYGLERGYVSYSTLSGDRFDDFLCIKGPPQHRAAGAEALTSELAEAAIAASETEERLNHPLT